MSPVLIDTHVLIWLFGNQLDKLGSETQRLVHAQFERLVVSAASLLEISLKQRKGGLPQLLAVSEIVRRLEAGGTPILDVKTQQLLRLPNRDEIKHADPFDLIFIAQAIEQGLPLLTCDAKILEATIPGLRTIDGRL